MMLINMKKIKIWILIPFIAVLTSCGNNDDDNGPSVIIENEINQFVYDALNSWYFYYDDVPDLQDNRFASIDAKNTFINNFDTPEALFNHLQHPNDRFSIIVSDYESLNNSQQGISESFGYEFGLILVNDDQVIGYVQYVLPGTPAESAGLKRGDIFNRINGTQLNLDNYVDLLFRNTSYTVGLVEIQDDNIVPIETEYDMTAVTLTENPVFLTKVIELDNGIKVGYLVYNRFTHTFHSELNQAFGVFQSAGVDELVVDLRYNLGGSVYTSMHLAGMIYNDATTSTVFGVFKHNSKKAGEEDFAFPFLSEVDVLDADFNTIQTERMNRLELSRVFILTSGSTASASEQIINGLDPYMEVILVGSTTIGKNEGSITVYDSPDTDFTSRNGINTNHKYAMQPIINRLSNSEGFTEYIDGFTPVPANQVNETDDLVNMKPLGDPEEIVLQRALEIINPSIARREIFQQIQVNKYILNSRSQRPYEDIMYMEKVSKLF